METNDAQRAREQLEAELDAVERSHSKTERVINSVTSILAIGALGLSLSYCAIKPVVSNRNYDLSIRSIEEGRRMTDIDLQGPKDRLEAKLGASQEFLQKNPDIESAVNSLEKEIQEASEASKELYAILKTNPDFITYQDNESNSKKNFYIGSGIIFGGLIGSAIANVFAHGINDRVRRRRVNKAYLI